MKNTFEKFRQEFITTMIIIVLLVFIGFTGAGRQSVNIAERVIGDVLSPIISITTKTVNVAKNTVTSIVNIPRLSRENTDLKKEIIELKNENIKLNDIVARSDHLKNEYDLIKNSKYNVVKATVIGKGVDDEDMYLIDKGSFSGIKKSDTVVVGIKSSENVAVEGLVGKVDKVGDTWANISLINKEDIGISFTNIRTQDGGILDSGDGGVLKGYTFENSSDIVAEDRLYTSGLGEIYAPRIYIGRVINVVNDEENMKKEIDVTPAVDLERLSSVLVIIGNKDE